MNHKASIYSNPVIPTGLYYAQLLDLDLDTSDSPYLWTCLALGEQYGAYSGTKLHSILYFTPKTEELVAKFKATFRIDEAHTLDEHLEALGRWGCVGVYESHYQNDEFLCVSFVRQNRQMRITCGMME